VSEETTTAEPLPAAEPNVLHQEFTSMPEPAAPKEESFKSDVDGLRSAADELRKRRERPEPSITRQYETTAGEHKGEPRPATESVTARRAASDLAQLRRGEAEMGELLASQEFQREVDADRAQAMQPDLQAQPAQPAQPTPADLYQPQPDVPAVAADDAELAKVLENPTIRGGIQAALDRAEAARQEYAQAAQQALQQVAMTSLAAVPELMGMNVDQARGALAVIAKQNPARYQEIASHLTRIEQVRQAMHHQQQAQRQQQQAAQQRAAQQTQTWMSQQDNAFESWAKTQPQSEVKQVREAVADVLVRQYGIDKGELAQLWNNNPLLRSAPVQRLLYDVTRYHMAQEAMATHRVKPLPPVQRPGTVGDFGYVDNTGVAEKMREFAGNPTPKSAAAALVARRRAARR
jgi:hypothetical protein